MVLILVAYVKLNELHMFSLVANPLMTRLAFLLSRKIPVCVPFNGYNNDSDDEEAEFKDDAEALEEAKYRKTVQMLETYELAMIAKTQSM